MPTVTKPRKSQVNARIDASLKRAGDEGLAAAGFTPTQAVTAVWELAAAHRDDPEVIVQALELDRRNAEKAARQAERMRRLKLIEEAPSIVEGILGERGIDRSSASADIWDAPIDELKESAFEEERIEATEHGTELGLSE